MITVPEAAEILNKMVEDGVTEGFLAIVVEGDHTVAITGFELVDDYCIATLEAEPWSR